MHRREGRPTHELEPIGGFRRLFPPRILRAPQLPHVFGKHQKGIPLPRWIELADVVHVPGPHTL